LKLRFIILFLGFSVYTCHAQHTNENNIREDRKIGLSLKFGGAYDILGGVSADYFISPQWNVELDIMPVAILSRQLYIGGGIAYHPLGKRDGLKWSPYAGILAGRSSGTAFLTGEKEAYTFLIVPFGVQYMASKGFQIAFDIGPSIVNEMNENTAVEGNENTFFYGPLPSVRIGYRF